MKMESEIEKTPIESLQKPRVCHKINLSLKQAFPLFGTMFVHDLILRQITNEMHSRMFRQLPIDTSIPNWIYALISKLIDTNLRYILPLHLLTFLIAIVSSFFASEWWGLATLKQMPQRLFLKRQRSWTKFIFISFMSLFSYGVLAVWLFLGLFHYSQNVYFPVACVLGFIAVLVKWVELGAIWNMGVGVIKEKHEYEGLPILALFSECKPVIAVTIALLHFYVCFSTTLSKYLKWNVEGVVLGGIIVVPLYIALVWRKMI